MEFSDLIGKTITGCVQKKLVEYNDTGFVELQFSDNTKAIIVSSYGDWEGGSYGEYPTEIYVTDNHDVKRFDSELEDFTP